uniref:tRNA(Ile)-lysidine synthase, chloroplastic n=1 Tax=Lophosiphonia teges TaxID=2007110 RepID=A0A1Z1MVD4_9FLOR|nr:tRNA Ile-lysidine synthetase [Polysiphonia teges]
MINNDLKKLEETIINFIRISKSSKILIPISGGQDSIFLIKLLSITKRKHLLKNIKLSYLYIDHQWKNNSKKQIEHIINYIKSVKEKIIIYQIKNITISESKCRKLRYHIITKHAIKHKYTLIITGHNCTDKIENFIRNIIRGSGIESLNSLNLCSQITKNIFLIRPLINFERTSIYWLCKKYCLPIWSDSTNYVYKIERNRVRQELVPYIQNYLQKNINHNIIRLSKNYQSENEYIKQNTIKLYLKNRHPFKMAINYSKLKKQNFILKKKTIELFCFHNFQIHLDKQQLTNFIKAIDKNNNKLCSKLENKYFQVFIYKSWLYVSIKE